MDELKKAWDVLEQIASTHMKAPPSSVARLAVMIPAIRDLPWDKVHSVKVDWNMIDGELVPTLDIVMKGDLP